MRIVAISDTHKRHDQLTLPEGDVLVFTGDLTGPRSDEINQLYEWLDWFSHTPYKAKIMIAGNHDFICERFGKVKMRSVCSRLNGVTYLEDTGVTVDGVRFWGSPWQPEFHRWAFNLKRGKALADVWAKIPEDTDVLLTHGPPLGILDRNNLRQNCGCRDLRERLKSLKVKLHCFGHIHEDYGHKVVGEVDFINSSIWDHTKNGVRDPIVFDLNKRAPVQGPF